MPDLSHRPTRYATALIAVAALAAGVVGHYDLRVGPDRRTAALKAENATLQLQAARLADQLRQRSTTSPGIRGREQQADAERRADGTPDPDSTTRPAPLIPSFYERPTLTAPSLSDHPALHATSATLGARGAGFSGAGNCSQYPNQEAAQAVFDRDRSRLAAMDGDGDRRACEQLRSATAPAPSRRHVPVAAVPDRATAPRPTRAPEPLRAPAVPAVPAQRPPRAAVPSPLPTKAPALPAAPSKAEILASGKHFGLSTATEQEFLRVESTLGRQASVEGFFKGFDTGYDRKRVTDAWAQGRIPLMTWESRPLTNPADTTDYSLSRIIAGGLDDYLTAYAREVKALGLPVIIRFDHEMNGNWNRWSEFESRTGVKKGEYVQAWRHVHDVFGAQGANDLVIWLWSPNRIDNLGRYAPISEYWPGDAYVDQIGMTGYMRREDRPPYTFAGTYDRTLAALRAVAPDKPLMLSEVGATEDGNRKTTWLQTFFSGLSANPDIAGFVWFNYAVSDGGHTDDWRLNSTLPAFGEFKTGLASIGYGLEVGKRLTLQPRVTVTSVPSPTAAPAASPTPAPAAAPLASPQPASVTPATPTPTRGTQP